MQVCVSSVLTTLREDLPRIWKYYSLLHLKNKQKKNTIIIIIIIIMYIYHAFINALSAHMIHIKLNTIFYTHVEHLPK